MGKDNASLAKRAKMLMWAWIGLLVGYIIIIGLSPLVVNVNTVNTVFGILIILLPLALLAIFIWGLVVIVKGAKAVNTGLGLYLALSLIISVIGIPYSLWDLGRKLSGGGGNTEEGRKENDKPDAQTEEAPVMEEPAEKTVVGEGNEDTIEKE